MTDQQQPTYWVRFEDADDRVIADPMAVAALPEIGQIIPISGTYCEVMERWTDRTYVDEGGPEIIVFTVKPLG
jgi:hypothetical protein